MINRKASDAILDSTLIQLGLPYLEKKEGEKKPNLITISVPIYVSEEFANNLNKFKLDALQAMGNNPKSHEFLEKVISTVLGLVINSGFKMELTRVAVDRQAFSMAEKHDCANCPAYDECDLPDKKPLSNHPKGKETLQ